MSSGFSVNQSYPLAGSSRARRRLLMNLAGGVAPGPETGLFDDLAAVEQRGEEEVGPVAAGSAMVERPADAPSVRLVRARENSGFLGIQQLLESSQAVTWVFTGDSITHGAAHTHGWRNYTEHFAERVRWELRRFQDVVINTAVAGELSEGLLRNLDVLALRFQPDVVSVMIGVYDAAAGSRGRKSFRDNLREIVARIRDDGAVALLHTPHRFLMDQSTEHADIRSYVRIIRETARELDAACVDHWSYWKRRRPNAAELRGWLADDGVHPCKYGHREMAKLIFARLGIFDEHSPTCAAKSP